MRECFSVLSLARLLFRGYIMESTRESIQKTKNEERNKTKKILCVALQFFGLYADEYWDRFGCFLFVKFLCLMWFYFFLTRSLSIHCLNVFVSHLCSWFIHFIYHLLIWCSLSFRFCMYSRGGRRYLEISKCTNTHTHRHLAFETQKPLLAFELSHTICVGNNRFFFLSLPLYTYIHKCTKCKYGERYFVFIGKTKKKKYKSERLFIRLSPFKSYNNRVYCYVSYYPCFFWCCCFFVFYYSINSLMNFLECLLFSFFLPDTFVTNLCFCFLAQKCVKRMDC